MSGTGTRVFSAWVDGGARGNPGPAGIGIRIVVDGVGEIYRRALYLGETTNNQAEYRALLHCLQVLEESGLGAGTVHSDSELLVKQIAGEYRVKDAGLKPLHAEALTRLGRLGGVRVRHIPRAQNADADALANIGMDWGSAGIGEAAG